MKSIAVFNAVAIAKSVGPRSERMSVESSVCATAVATATGGTFDPANAFLNASTYSASER
jgi:hypothetical protein